ncbi:hypothetical protein R9C00_20075 [Flammeovirgaceae bacterium SG7u.111]|nr:hypothetical protein [Flammeovirgaceae bacterium SG7u.132]WPO33999.1 hypothetical protein R9C00_20075 [Flammeovirgaceae bacterium SG7u.111]
MELDRLAVLIKEPDAVSESDVAMLDSLAEEYPYFQAVKLLRAKALKTSEAIKSAAVLTSDRVLLMKLINSSFDKDINLPNIDHINVEDGAVNAFSSLSGDEAETQVTEEPEVSVPIVEEEFSSVEYGQETMPVDEPFEKETFEEEAVDEGYQEYKAEIEEKSVEFDAPEYDLPADYGKLEQEEHSVEDSEDETETVTNEVEEVPAVEPISKELNLEDEDVFRSELMKSLEDLKRTREQVAEDESARVVEDTPIPDPVVPEPIPIPKEEDFEDMEDLGLGDDLGELKELDTKEDDAIIFPSDEKLEDDAFEVLDDDDDDVDIDSSFFDLNTMIDEDEDSNKDEKKK